MVARPLKENRPTGIFQHHNIPDPMCNISRENAWIVRTVVVCAVAERRWRRRLVRGFGPSSLVHRRLRTARTGHKLRRTARTQSTYRRHLINHKPTSVSPTAQPTGWMSPPKLSQNIFEQWKFNIFALICPNLGSTNYTAETFQLQETSSPIARAWLHSLTRLTA